MELYKNLRCIIRPYIIAHKLLNSLLRFSPEYLGVSLELTNAKPLLLADIEEGLEMGLAIAIKIQKLKN